MSGTTAIIAVAIVLALIALVATRRRTQRSEWDTAAAALRLEPVAALDSVLTAAVIALHRPPVPDTTYEQKQTWSLTRIYRYPEPGLTCYSITVHLEQTGEIWRSGRTLRTESRETRVVAVVAPDLLQAPPMKLVPRAVADPAGGALAAIVQAANAMTDAAAEHGGDQVEFADDPAFDRQYLVLSPQPLPARTFLDVRRRRELAGLEGLQVSVEGSLMLVSSPTDAIRHRGRALEESLRAELENARRVLTLFTANRPAQ